MKGGYGAVLVATGILLSRFAGLIRGRVFAHFFGSSAVADAFNAALRIPNFLQNLFGEGVLSASFVPVYARALAVGNREEADRTASVVGTLLAISTAVLVLLGVLATPVLIALIAPGFSGDKRALTIQLTRILFPGIGLLVLSAWCLGILNSHRKFFLSYAAPVVWNAAIIAALLGFGARTGQVQLASIAAWGAVGGSVLQLAVQLPAVLRLAGRLRFALDLSLGSVRTVLRNFLPAVLSRGVLQVSAYVDAVLASWLPTGAVAALGYAQAVYLLPIALFGMSVSSAELPGMSSAGGDASEAGPHIRGRLGAGLRQISFFIVPSAAAMLAFGDSMTAMLYQTGEFRRADAVYVWGILAGYAVGLLAAGLSRLYVSAFYALRETRTPLRFAILRVVIATVLGSTAALLLPAALGLDRRWGVAGLTLASSISGWVEFLLVRRALIARIGAPDPGRASLARFAAAAAAAVAVGWAVKLATAGFAALWAGVLVLGAFGVVYIAASLLMRAPEAHAVFAPLRRVLARRP